MQIISKLSDENSIFNRISLKYAEMYKYAAGQKFSLVYLCPCECDYQGLNLTYRKGKLSFVFTLLDSTYISRWELLYDILTSK